MFELCYCRRYKAILASIVLSQQCNEVYIIFSYSSEAVMKLTTTEVSHSNVTVTSWTSVAPAVLFSLDLGFLCFIWGSGVFIENLGGFQLWPNF